MADEGVSGQNFLRLLFGGINGRGGAQAGVDQIPRQQAQEADLTVALQRMMQQQGQFDESQGQQASQFKESLAQRQTNADRAHDLQLESIALQERNVTTNEENARVTRERIKTETARQKQQVNAREGLNKYITEGDFDPAQKTILTMMASGINPPSVLTRQAFGDNERFQAFALEALLPLFKDEFGSFRFPDAKELESAIKGLSGIESQLPGFRVSGLRANPLEKDGVIPKDGMVEASSTSDKFQSRLFETVKSGRWGTPKDVAAAMFDDSLFDEGEDGFEQRLRALQEVGLAPPSDNPGFTSTRRLIHKFYNDLLAGGPEALESFIEDLVAPRDNRANRPGRVSTPPGAITGQTNLFGGGDFRSRQ